MEFERSRAVEAQTWATAFDSTSDGRRSEGEGEDFAANRPTLLVHHHHQHTSTKMPAALSGHPTLTPPTVLGSYGLATGRAGDALFQTQAASSSRLSHAAIGEAVKISSGTVRRARGLLATIVAGNAVTLYDVSSR